MNFSYFFPPNRFARSPSGQLEMRYRGSAVTSSSLLQRWSKTGNLIPAESAMTILPLDDYLVNSSHSVNQKDDRFSNSLQELLLRAGEVLEFEDNLDGKGRHEVP